MNDPNLNTAFKWAIENSSASGTPKDAPKTELHSSAVAALFGALQSQETDGTRMENNMKVAKNKEAPLKDRLIALDNFEQLVENLDNANYMETASLWTPLIEQLEDENAGIRELAANCCGTAVQNNIRTQERLLIIGAIPTLMRLATEDPSKDVRKNAITALSSEARNFQPGLDAAIEHAPAEFKPKGKLDASDMESVDILISKLRDSV